MLNSTQIFISMRKRSQKWLLIFKIILPFFFIGAITWQLVYKLDFNYLLSEFRQEFHDFRIELLLLAVLLMPVNWFLELLKWKGLVDIFQERTLKESMKSILSGVCLSIITPHRIGEYAGRLIGIQKQHYWKAVFSTGVSGFAQNIIILAGGILALIFVFDDIIGVNVNFKNELITICAIILLLLAFSLYRLDIIFSLVQKLNLHKLFSHFEEALLFVKHIPTVLISRTLLFAALRYLVYTVQFVLILQFFHVDLPMIISFPCVAMIFLIQSGIPLPALANLFARGEISILIFSFWSVNELSVLCSTLILWIINLLIPALMGLMIIEKTKMLKHVEDGI